jgi:hypothetical protein
MRLWVEESEEAILHPLTRAESVEVVAPVVVPVDQVPEVPDYRGKVIPAAVALLIMAVAAVAVERQALPR